MPFYYENSAEASPTAHAPPSPSTQTQETSAPLQTIKHGYAHSCTLGKANPPRRPGSQTIRAVLERNFRMAEEVLEQGEAENAGNIRSDLGCVRQRRHGPKDPCSIPEINFENRSNPAPPPPAQPSQPTQNHPIAIEEILR